MFMSCNSSECPGIHVLRCGGPGGSSHRRSRPGCRRHCSPLALAAPSPARPPRVPRALSHFSSAEIGNNYRGFPNKRALIFVTSCLSNFLTVQHLRHRQHMQLVVTTRRMATSARLTSTSPHGSTCSWPPPPSSKWLSGFRPSMHACICCKSRLPLCPMSSLQSTLFAYYVPSMAYQDYFLEPCNMGISASLSHSFLEMEKKPGCCDSP